MVVALLLVLAGLFISFLAARATALEMLSTGTNQVSTLIVGQPDVVLGTALGEFATHRGRLPAQRLPAIRAAAAHLPLDSRPYLLVGGNYLTSGQDKRAFATLEAGRRLNPRQRWIHILLLEHYLRTGQYAIAADEFAVLSRLVGEAQAPIATALAQMSIAPQTRDAVRLTLKQDPALERAVLTSLASSNIDPAVIFRMASPSALAAASLPGGWGSTLVDRLVQKHRYALAKSIWQRINGLSAQASAALLFDADLQQPLGKPPFGWKLASDNVAAVDVRDGRFNIDYYGRDSGELASQLLTLTPGSYRFGYVVNLSQQSGGSNLVWTVTCDNAPDRTLARTTVPASPNSRAVAFGFVVPADCPAQWLRLSGQAAEFPVAISAAIDRLQLDKVTAK